MATGNFGVFEKFLDLATEGQQSQRNNLRTYSVQGYPIFFSWGILSAIEIDQDQGRKKAHFLLPNVGTPVVSLESQWASHPCSLYLSGDVDYPQNLKLRIPNHINSTQLEEGRPYLFMAAIKAAAVGGGNRGGNATGYFDGYLCSIFDARSDDFVLFQKFLTDYLNSFQMLELEVPKRNNGTSRTAPPPPPTASATAPATAPVATAPAGTVPK